MAKTAQLDLPLVMPAQAQKHVTVNEALARLDAVAQLRVVSSTVQEPPAVASDGTSYLVPPVPPVHGWEGRATSRSGATAAGSSSCRRPAGGPGTRAEAGIASSTGTDWVADALVVSPDGAGYRWRVVEFDHAIAPGATNLTATVVPVQAQVLGVTGRVVASLTGPGLTGWRIGVAGSDDRYGSGLGLAAELVSGRPERFAGDLLFADAAPALSRRRNPWQAGSVRLAIHFLELEPPRPV